MAEDESKIIIDEDWKARVEREREEARKTGDKGPDDDQTDTQEAAEAGEVEEGASFLTLVSSLATQTMFALGVVAPRDATEVQVDLGQAKFLIDTLMVLREKTEGNLTPEESGQLTQIVGELQSIYVARAQQVQESALKNAGVNPNDLKAE